MNTERAVASAYRVFPLREAMAASGIHLLYAPESDRGEWKDILQVLNEVLDDVPHEIRGSCISASIYQPKPQQRGRDTSSVQYFLNPLRDALESSGQLTNPTIVGPVIGELGRQFPDVNIQVSPEERLRAWSYKGGVGSVTRIGPTLPNGVCFVCSNPSGLGLGHAGINFVDLSQVSANNRGLVSQRQAATSGILIKSNHEWQVHVSEENYQAIIGPERIREADFAKLTPINLLIQIARTLRFNNAFPDRLSGRYPQAPRLRGEALATLCHHLGTIEADQIADASPYQVASIMAEFAAGFLLNPYTTALLLASAHPGLFTLLNLEALLVSEFQSTFGQLMNSQPYHTEDPSQRFDVSHPLLQLATPEAQLMARRLTERLPITNEYVHNLNWRMDDLSAHLALRLAFCPVPITD